MHGIATDRLDRNRSVALSNYSVTYGCMNDLQAAAHYLQNLLPDMVAEFEPWPSSKARFLPHSLNSMFRLAEIDLLGLRVLLAKVPTQAEPTPPSRLIAQVHLLAEKAGLRVVLVLSGVSPYTRSRLIESRVNFVVPGSQLFAPSFLMSLRERDSSPPVPLSVGRHLSHPAQAVLIAALLRPDFEERGIPGSVPWVPLELAREAGYSRMTASRVAREPWRLTWSAPGARDGRRACGSCKRDGPCGGRRCRGCARRCCAQPASARVAWPCCRPMIVVLQGKPVCPCSPNWQRQRGSSLDRRRAGVWPVVCETPGLVRGHRRRCAGRRNAGSTAVLRR